MKRRDDFLPFCRHWIGAAEERAVLDVLRSDWITTGPVTGKFEAAFAAYVNSPFAVAVSSCTGGLFMAYQGLGIGPGDEVVVPAMTWPATANAAVLLGARVVFADVDYETLCVTRETLAPCLTDRTRAVVLVHFAGLACDLDPIVELCRSKGVAIIEDCAHAIGSRYKGRHVGGDYAFASVYSFHPIKNVTTGEGGMVTCHDGKLFRKLALAKFHGISRDAWKAYKGGSVPLYDVEFPALKFNLTDIQSAIGLAQLSRLPEFAARRRLLSQRYLEALSGVQGLDLPAGGDGHAWHLFVVKLNARARINREEFIVALRELNVGAGIHFLPVNTLSCYRNAGARAAPAAEKAGGACVSLPLYPLMSDADADYVADCARYVLG